MLWILTCFWQIREMMEGVWVTYLLEQYLLLNYLNQTYRLSGKQPPPRLQMLSTLKVDVKDEPRAPSGWTMRSLVKQQEQRALQHGQV